MLAYGRLNVPALMVEWFLVVTFSILIHELGHALTGKYFGLKPAISFHGLGGLTWWIEAKPTRPWQDLLISLAGVCAGFCFALIIYFAKPLFFLTDSWLLIVTYEDLLWVNVGWGIFNLLPMLPLDGGHAFGAVERWVTNRADCFYTEVVSLLVAIGIALWALNAKFVWIAFICGWCAITSGTALWQRFQKWRDESLQEAVNQAQQHIEQENYKAAQNILLDVKSKAYSDAAKQKIAHLLIVSYINAEDYEKAEEGLRIFEILYGKNDYLAGWLYFKQGKMPQAVIHFQSVFESTSSTDVGVLLYHSLAGAQRFKEALAICSNSILTEVRIDLLAHLQHTAFMNNDFETSAEAGGQAFAIQPDPQVAFNIACALARSAKISEGLEWIARAVEAGFNDYVALMNDNDLEALHSASEFEEIIMKAQDNRND